MTITKTVLEWPYQPADYFEFPYRKTTPDHEILVQDGMVTLTLSSPLDPVPDDLKSRIAFEIEAIFLARQLQTHRRFDLKDSRTTQHTEDGRRIIYMSGFCAATAAMKADIQALDSAGNVVWDSKAERKAEDTRWIDEFAPMLARSPLLQVLIASYGAAVNDPEDEMVHLYEIREALASHFGGEDKARRQLGIAKDDWRRLRLLANVEPIAQSRHRGKHLASMRPATKEELEEVREIARRLILAYAGTI